VAESTKTTKSTLEVWVLFLLSVLTILVNGIALSAILFRISEWGITPNRAAVLGSNILILANLLLVTVQLFRVIFKRSEISGVGKVIAFFLPFYFVWALLVTVLFPFLFGFE
jgi:NADH:ubiquinone oxidoreductase subunit K